MRQTSLSKGDRFANEPDIAGLSRAYAKMRTDWPYALSEFKSLAEQGSVMSMLYIADAYLFGIGATIDLKEHERWLQRARESGSASAAYKLGLLYLRTGDRDRAMENLLLSASLNFTPAVVRLGSIYARGQFVPIDTKIAREFLERAHSSGHAIARKELARLLIRGKFGLLQAMRGLGLYLTMPLTIIKIGYRHSKLSDDGSSVIYDEELQ